jgi:hypothetical protein
MNPRFVIGKEGEGCDVNFSNFSDESCFPIEADCI